MRLKVERLESDDVYQNRIRLHRDFRGKIRIGQIARLSTSMGSALVEVRAKTGTNDLVIQMDQSLRAKLGVKPDDVLEFSIKAVGLLGQISWAAQATDPRVSIAARLGILALFLGIISVLIALIPFVLMYYKGSI